MIQFFRRVRQKLLLEGSVSKYLFYAIGEIALVMIGILLALQVNNWNENRKNNIEELQILRELKEDMLVNLERINFGISIMDRQLNQINRGLALYDNLNIPQDSIKAILRPFFSRMVMTFDPANGTIQSILNGDRLKLIRNFVLRRKLVDWSALIEDVKEEERKILGLKENDLIPFMNSCCPRALDRDFNIQKIVSDYKFENLLLDYQGVARISRRDYLPVKVYIEEIIDLINQELE